MDGIPRADGRGCLAPAVKIAVVLIIFAIISLLAIVAVIVSVLRKMLKPIDKVVSAAKQIAVGDLNIEITADSEDEIGILSVAFQDTVAC